MIHGAGILHTSLAACLVLLLGIMVGLFRMLRPIPNLNTNYGSSYSQVSFKGLIFGDFDILDRFGLAPVPPEDGVHDQGGHDSFDEHP